MAREKRNRYNNVPGTHTEVQRALAHMVGRGF
jgi:hypothetical protein